FPPLPTARRSWRARASRRQLTTHAGVEAPLEAERRARGAYQQAHGRDLLRSADDHANGGAFEPEDAARAEHQRDDPADAAAYVVQVDQHGALADAPDVDGRDRALAAPAVDRDDRAVRDVA